MDAVKPERCGRFCLTDYSGSQAVMQGWCNDRAAADQKSAGWVGEFESLPAAQVFLADGETGQELDSWPAALPGDPNRRPVTSKLRTAVGRV
ncbi:hypothetical protein [Streptomyces similanensis]|uniref:Uncharacterized protein n=1 Tax=Streptomyces similanensis TaxID=1274988 RepID=A0ABP9LL51_9ACTN